MNKKLHNLKHIKYLTNFDIIANTFIDWQEKKPTETVDKLMSCLIEINHYVMENYNNELYHSQSLSEYRSDKLRAIDRAVKAEDKVDELQKQIDKLIKEKELGI